MDCHESFKDGVKVVSHGPVLASEDCPGIQFLRNGRSLVPSRSLARDSTGVAAVEYAVLIAPIAIAIVASLGNVGSGVRNDWDEVNAAMTDPGLGFNSTCHVVRKRPLSTQIGRQRRKVRFLPISDTRVTHRELLTNTHPSDPHRFARADT